MAKKNIVNLTNDELQIDRDTLNKQVFYPIIEAGYNIAKTEATSHKLSGELLANLRTVSLAKKSKSQVGYVLLAGRRSDYKNNSPHFLFYYAYKKGKIGKAIKRAVRSEINKMNGK